MQRNLSIMEAKQKRDKKWYYKLRNKYRLVLFNDKTFEERFTFRLTRLNVILMIVSLSVILISITFLLVAYTPLKTYVPGYPDIDQRKGLYNLNILADSLKADIQKKSLYIENIKRIVNNQDVVENYDQVSADSVSYDTINDRISTEDSLFRVEFENRTKYNLYNDNYKRFNPATASVLKNLNFYKPLDGIITSRFNPKEKHYGIDIVAAHNEAVKSVLDGTVVLSAWTLETGYVLVIEHAQNLLTVYKHNASLLKREGDMVKAGEPVAIAGQSGELTTGPHLHFELWDRGKPIDPQQYILFK